MPQPKNAFVDLLTQFPRKYSCPKMYCSTCGGQPNRYYWVRRDVEGFVRENPEAISEDLFNLRPIDITLLPDWKTALNVTIASIWEGALAIDLPRLLRRWSENLRDAPDFAAFISQEVFQPNFEIEETDKIDWLRACLDVVNETKDCNLIRSLLAIDSTNRAPSRLQYLAAEVAFSGQYPDLSLDLLLTDGVDPMIRRRLIEHTLWPFRIKRYVFELVNACRDEQEDLRLVLSKLIPERLNGRVNGHLVFAIAKQLGYNHQVYVELMNRAMQEANVSRDFGLAMGISKADRAGNIASMATRLAVEIALESKTVERTVEVLRSGLAPPDGTQLLLNRLITAARGGDQVSIRALCTVIGPDHALYQEARTLELQLDQDLADAANRRIELEAERRAGERREQIEAQRQVQRERNDARELFLAAISILEPAERLRHIASDENHPINFYPTDWAEVSNATLLSIPKETIDRLCEKLAQAQRGPWRSLRRALLEIQNDD